MSLHSVTSADAKARVRAFADIVFRRCDGEGDVVPAGHEPDWDDAPARYRIYPGRPRISLPGPLELQQRFDASRTGRKGGAVPDLAQLSVLLYLTLAPLRRKVDITWNVDIPNIGFLAHEFGRGSASGGGLYPTQIYLVSAGTATLGAGVYHYGVADHSLVPLRHGSYQGVLDHALGGGHRHPYYLVLAPDFWMNCVKYHNFGMHVCSQDAGALLGTVQVACDSLGIAQRSFTLFDDALVNLVTGADGFHETSFAVVGLGEPQAAAAAERNLDAVRAELAATPVPQPWQKSRDVRISPMLDQIQRLTWLDAAALPPLLESAHEAPRQAGQNEQGCGMIEPLLRHSLPSVLHARRSAWGSLHSDSPVTRGELLELLRFVWRRAAPEFAPLREALPEGSLSLAMQVNHCPDLARGAYRYDPASDDLVALGGEQPDRWQSTYAWYNYNIEETNCALFVTGDIDAVMARYGARGYRVLNACVGMMAQLCYVGATALSLDCGAVLGARAQQVKRCLNLSENENVCIAFYLSRSQAPVHLFDYSLVPDVPNWKKSV